MSSSQSKAKETAKEEALEKGGPPRVFAELQILKDFKSCVLKLRIPKGLRECFGELRILKGIVRSGEGLVDRWECEEAGPSAGVK